MKNIIPVLCLLGFTAVIARAEDWWSKGIDYHLVQTQMLDSELKEGQLLTVYVLIAPDGTRPQVFKTFGSREMEARISSLPNGSVVYYEVNSFLPRVQRGQFESLKAACEKKGVSFIENPRLLL